jgi:two-component system NtrC family sensor kinase
LGNRDRSPRVLRRFSFTCGGVCAAIGLAALSGWASRSHFLMGVRESYIPMAPNTALSFVVLGLGLIALASEMSTSRESGRETDGREVALPVKFHRHWWARTLAGLGASLVALISCLRLFEFSTGKSFDVDSWFLQVPTDRLGLAPLGKMASFTAIGFFGGALSLALRIWAKEGAVIDFLAGLGAVITGAIGLVFGMGYLFSPNSPLLYGSETIPMALNTALAFVALGAGLAAVGGPGSFPVRRLCGPSIRARLLRVFSPLIVGTVVFVAWLTHVVSTSAGASSAAISSAALATAAIFLFGVFLEQMAGRVGQQIERAEAALQQAHDELEIKVEERTMALSQANADLAKAFRELNLAHISLQKTHQELTQTQGRMIQQAKLASLGQTAAGVAHEINNPLAFVTNNLVVLKREVAGLHDILQLYQQAENTLAEYQHELHERIQELSEEVDLPYVLANLDSLLDRSRDGLKRIQRIIQDLRDFARLDEAEYKEVDLNAGIRSTVNILRGLAEKRQVTLETELAPIPRLVCYPVKINMVVQNLVLNAIDACDRGGRVVVRTRTCHDDIEVEVCDNGSGIDPAIQQKVFDPFFTTKPIGMGTGLGLSMSYGIIRDHGGTIDFTSTTGEGTRFFFRLPQTAELCAMPANSPVAVEPG